MSHDAADTASCVVTTHATTNCGFVGHVQKNSKEFQMLFQV